MSDPLYFDEITCRRLDELQNVLERVAVGLEKIVEDKDELAKTNIIDTDSDEPISKKSNSNDLLKILISAQMFCEQSNCGLCMEAIKMAQRLIPPIGKQEISKEPNTDLIIARLAKENEALKYDNEGLHETAINRESWLKKAKQEAGYPDRTSFDIVWSETLNKTANTITTLKRIVTDTEEAMTASIRTDHEILIDLVAQLKSMTGQP